MIRAGTMRHVLQIIENTPIVDNSGAVEDVWAVTGTARASINPITGTESFVNAEQMNEVSHKIGMRYRDISPEARLGFQGREFDIVNVLNFKEKKSNIILLVKERLSDV